jgi:Icc-related predicted phosphoesterase
VRIHVVTDIHGNFTALPSARRGADLFVILGDFLDYVDYSDPGAGVLGTLFGSENVGALATLRKRGLFGDMHAMEERLWRSIADPEGSVAEVVTGRYLRAVEELSGGGVLVTLGNVDVPSIWSDVAPLELRCRDGEVVEVDGLRLGFVAGGALKSPPTTRPWQYFDRSHAEYLGSVAALGRIDLLFSHVPPKIPELRFDTIAGRHEMYGPGLLELIEESQPLVACSGHVHHPQVSSISVGRTLCVNAGYFRKTGRPYVIDLEGSPVPYFHA